MSLLKALAVVGSRGLQAGAEVLEERDKEENELTKLGVANVLKQVESARKASAERVKKNAELQNEISGLQGLIYGIDENTKASRPLNPNEIGQLLTTIGKEDLIKYGMSEDTRLQVGGKAIGTETELALGIPSISETIKTITETTPEKSGYFYEGQGQRISNKIEKQLRRLGISTDTPVNATTLQYKGGTFKILPETEDVKISKTLLFSDGADNVDILVGQTDTGRLMMLDPRFLEDDKKPRPFTETGFTLQGTVGTAQDEAMSINKSVLVDVTIDGTEMKGVSAFLDGTDGKYYINDPRVIKGGKNIPLPPEYENLRNVPSRQEVIGAGGPAVALGDEVVKSLGGTTNFKELQKRFTDTGSARLALKQTYDSMWEEAGNEEVYSFAVTTAGGLINRAKIELEGIGIVLSPSKENQERKDRVRQVTSAEKYIEKVTSDQDYIKAGKAAVQARVLDSKIFVAAVRQAQADGEDRPTDADIARRMEMFRAKTPLEFYLKAQDNVVRAQDDYTRAYQAFTGPSNPMFNRIRMLENGETENEQKAALYLKQLYLGGEESPDIATEKYMPVFLSTEDPEKLQGEPSKSLAVVDIEVVGPTGISTTLKYDPKTEMYFHPDYPDKALSLADITDKKFKIK